MTEQNEMHPTLGRRRRHKSPSALQSDPLLSIPSKHPNEYDAVMGITQVGPREAARFEEGVEPEFLDAVEEAPKVSDNVSENKPDSGHASSASHGGYGSASLQECLNVLNQARSNCPAPCHSGVDNDAKSDPPHAQIGHDTTLVLLS